VTARADSTGHEQAWKRDPSDVASHVASRRLTQGVNQHKQKKTGKTLQHMRAATLTLDIVHLPTDSVRKVYRVKRNKAKGKVCKSKRAAPGKSPGRVADKSPAGTTGQKRKAAGSLRPNKRRNVAASEPEDMDEDHAFPQCELMDVFCAFQEQGEHITFAAMAREQRKRIMLQLEDYEHKYQVTLHAEDKKPRAAYADLVVTMVEKKEDARAGEGGEGGSDGAGTRARAQKLSTTPGVVRTGAQGARSAPAATGAYVTILKLSIASDAKVAALKGLLLVEQDERILQVFCNSWETGKRWSRLAERLEAIGQ
jgi:hypothetical protein